MNSLMEVVVPVMAPAVCTVCWLNHNPDQVTAWLPTIFSLPLVGPPGPLMDHDKQQLHFASLSQALSGFPLFFSALREERSRARAVERVMVVCQAHHLSFTHFTQWWSVHFAARKLYLQTRFGPIFTMVSIWLCIKLTLEFKCDHISLTLPILMR